MEVPFQQLENRMCYKLTVRFYCALVYIYTLFPVFFFLLLVALLVSTVETKSNLFEWNGIFTYLNRQIT